MIRENIRLQRSETIGQTFERKAKLLCAFGPAIPAIVRNDRAIDLDAGGETAGYRFACQQFGVSPFCDGSPGDAQHRR